jgi:hypothetical protein
VPARPTGGPPPGSTCQRPYSSASPWNTPIAAQPAINASSAYDILTLGSNFGSDPTQYTFPVYSVSPGGPMGTVAVSGVFGNMTPAAMTTSRGNISLPLPAGVQPASGSDSQAIILNPATGDEWGFWQLAGSPPSMTAVNGYHYNTNWDAVTPGPGPRGAGIPYLAGLVRPCEIAQGHIDHALAFSYQDTSPAHVYPASKSDGSGSGMPEGTRIQLDPSVSDAMIQSWGCTGACFTVAKALQVYGAYLTDTAGHPKLYFEADITAHWNGAVTAATTTHIPYTALRVVN